MWGQSYPNNETCDQPSFANTIGNVETLEPKDIEASYQDCQNCLISDLFPYFNQVLGELLK